MIQKLRQEFPLELLMSIAQLACSTYYYHVKRQLVPDKCRRAKEQITAIYHENKGRYGYRRITTEFHLFGQKLYYNNRRIKAKLKGLPPAIHRQQALEAASSNFV